MGVDTSRYWKICMITNPIDRNCRLTRGYTDKQLNRAREFFEKQFPSSCSQKTLSPQANKNVQLHLWKMFHDDNLDIYSRALAGLCLRCYISHAIAKACKIIAASTYKVDTPKLFTYHDLLPYILTDDGKSLSILNTDGKTQLILKGNGSTQPVPNKGKYQSVEILRTYNPKLSKRGSLDNWAIMYTQQNKEVKKLLLEYKVRIPSDWSLLCKDIPHSLKSHLQNGDDKILEVFYQVYRRDRLYFGQTGKCLNPTKEQLQEMLCSLQEQHISLSCHEELIMRLKGIAYILRQDMYSLKLGIPDAQSIDTPSYFPDDDNYWCQLRLPPGAYLDLESIEWQELLNVVNALLIKVLSQAIAQRISDKISNLAKDRKYGCFATKFTEGLELYYQKTNPLSISEIADLWCITKPQARQIFKLKKFIKATEYLTEEMLIENLIENPVDSRLNSISKSPEKLRSVITAIKEYTYQMAFKEAFAETTAGRYRSRDSLFAQLLRQYLNNKHTKCSINKTISISNLQINCYQR